MPTPVYECVQSALCPDEWVAEAIDYDDEGVIYAALFSGPDAQKRAEEYTAWMNRPRLPPAVDDGDDPEPLGFA